MNFPDIDQGIQELLKSSPGIAPVVDSLVPITDMLDGVVDATHSSNTNELTKLRNEVVSRFGSTKLGHLLSNYVINREEQMQRLMALGKDALLSIIAQGMSTADISRELHVSYDTVQEYVSRTCTPEEVKVAETRYADMMISTAVHDVETAMTRDEVLKGSKLLEAKFKLANRYSDRFKDKTPNTAVQVNNTFHDGVAPPDGTPALLNITGLLPKEELPPLKEHSHVIDSEAEYVPAGLKDGKFTSLEEFEE